MNVVDTSGWLEYFAETKNAVNYEKAINETDRLIVPAIVLYDVFKKVSMEYDENRALVAIAHMKLGRVVAIDETIAINGARISMEKKIPMADSLIYATAEMFGAMVYTQDEHFSKLPNVRYFRK